jgi:hypothetical protein
VENGQTYVINVDDKFLGISRNSKICAIDDMINILDKEYGGVNTFRELERIGDGIYTVKLFHEGAEESEILIGTIVKCKIGDYRKWEW